MSEQYEVELKFRVENFQKVELLLAEKNAVAMPGIIQRDQYYQHPCRDFVETDEALRIRRSGDDVCITWKGPRLDVETKTRREIELPMNVQHDQQWGQLLQQLGFQPAGKVKKHRREFELTVDERKFHIALDEVELGETVSANAESGNAEPGGAGGIGYFVEIETLAVQSSLSACRASLLQLADEFELNDPTSRSYLSLVREPEATN